MVTLPSAAVLVPDDIRGRSPLGCPRIGNAWNWKTDSFLIWQAVIISLDRGDRAPRHDDVQEEREQQDGGERDRDRRRRAYLRQGDPARVREPPRTGDTRLLRFVSSVVSRCVNPSRAPSSHMAMKLGAARGMTPDAPCATMIQNVGTSPASRTRSADVAEVFVLLGRGSAACKDREPGTPRKLVMSASRKPCTVPSAPT
jgi:hypothetical protein